MNAIRMGGRFGRGMAVAGLVLWIALAGCASVERDQTTGEFVDDAVITSRVKTRLAQELGAGAVAISVETHNRVVLLRGFVDTETLREKAVSFARSVPGVREVNGEGLVLTPQRRGG